MTADPRDLIRRLTVSLDVCLAHLDREAVRERLAEEGKPLRKITAQERAKEARQAVAEGYALLDPAQDMLLLTLPCTDRDWAVGQITLSDPDGGPDTTQTELVIVLDDPDHGEAVRAAIAQQMPHWPMMEILAPDEMAPDDDHARH